MTNADLVGSDQAIQLSGIDLTLDSSIITTPIAQNPNVPSSCTITFSAGPTTSGTSCQSFQTLVPARFLDPSNTEVYRRS